MKGKWNGLAGFLVLAGALNWGLIGAFGFNFVAAVFGPVAWVVYVAVGWAGVYKICCGSGRRSV